MNMEAVFGHFPLLESEKLVLSKNEEKTRTGRVFDL